MARIRVKVPVEELEQPSKPDVQDMVNRTQFSLPTIQLPRFSKKQIIIFSLGFVFLLGGLYIYALQTERNDLKAEIERLKTDPAIVARKQNEIVLQRVGMLMELPLGEKPNIYDVTDAQAAQKQDKFYENAQNGDKVLFYMQAGKGILYRPSTNKIINTAPIAQPTN